MQSAAITDDPLECKTPPHSGEKTRSHLKLPLSENLQFRVLRSNMLKKVSTGERFHYSVAETERQHKRTKTRSLVNFSFLNFNSSVVDLDFIVSLTSRHLVSENSVQINENVFLKCFKISGELWLLGYCVFFKGLYKLYQTG